MTNGVSCAINRDVYDLVVTGGNLATGSETRRGSIAITSGRIAAILPEGGHAESRETVDAAGKYVIPGAIDAHVHVWTVYSPAADTIETASRAAAHGGITTFLFFIGVSKGTKPVRSPENGTEALPSRREAG